MVKDEINVHQTQFKTLMLLLITNQYNVRDEAKIIQQIASFDSCIIHVRKPNYSLIRMTQWLEQFSNKTTQKMMLHQHHQLYEHFPIRGIHLKESHKNSVVSLPKEHKMTLSAAYHNSAEAQQQSRFDYSVLSPVFDSISKANVKGKKFNVQNSIKPIIALGGVDAENMTIARNLGFQGVGVLGTIWRSENPIEAFKTIEKTYQNVYG